MRRAARRKPRRRRAKPLVVPVFVGEGALGSVSLRDAVLLGCQLRDRFRVFPVGRHSRSSFLFCIEDRHGWATVQSPPAIETMPGSTLKVFQSAGADSLAPGDGSD